MDFETREERIHHGSEYRRIRKERGYKTRDYMLVIM